MQDEVTQKRLPVLQKMKVFYEVEESISWVFKYEQTYSLDIWRWNFTTLRYSLCILFFTYALFHNATSRQLMRRDFALIQASSSQ